MRPLKFVRNNWDETILEALLEFGRCEITTLARCLLLNKHEAWAQAKELAEHGLVILEQRGLALHALRLSDKGREKIEARVEARRERARSAARSHARVLMQIDKYRRVSP